MNVQWKADNIGYLDLRAFPAVDVASEKAIAVMKFLSNMDAIIIDLRSEVMGGTPEMVALICSYFFEKPTLLDKTHFRKSNSTLENWTLEKVDGRRMADVPLYILTGKEVFSAGEAFTYSLQALKRALVIGEVTKGGAHLTRPAKLNDRFVFYLPFGRTFNPITGTNWEGVGVKPDIAVDADKALDTAIEIAKKAAAKHRQVREAGNIRLAKDIFQKFMSSVQQYAAGEKQKSLASLQETLAEGYDSDILTEEMINQAGYDLLNQGLVEVAIEMFKFNVKQFPNSYNAYDSLAEAFMSKGDYKLATENYEKSLAINPHNTGAIKNLAEMINK